MAYQFVQELMKRLALSPMLPLDAQISLPSYTARRSKTPAITRSIGLLATVSGLIQIRNVTTHHSTISPVAWS